MGDTVIPVKAFIQKEKAALFYFRGALLPEYGRALDELFIHAERQVPAITMAEHMPRNEALLLAMLVGVNRDPLRLYQKLGELEEFVLHQPGTYNQKTCISWILQIS